MHTVVMQGHIAAERNHVARTRVDRKSYFHLGDNYTFITCSVDKVALEQGSATYGLRARCGSFDDCIWLADKS